MYVQSQIITVHRLNVIRIYFYGRLPQPPAGSVVSAVKPKIVLEYALIIPT